MSRNGYAHMVLDYYVARLRARRAVRHDILAGLQTRDDALRYRDYVRATVAVAFGQLPERTPLRARVAGVVEGDGCRIERVSFESRPGYVVTASLYVPSGLTGRAPAVVGLCGHAQEGKASETYQGFVRRLAANGFVALLVDPVHQGERDQYALLREAGRDLGLGRGLCEGHNMMGKQLEVLGESLAAWRVWDIRRALDYLLTRPEVDPARIGVTGNSGGGTLTEWAFACDDRFAMAAPSCHVTSFLTNLENELPTDAEQCPPGVIGAGLEMVDLLFAQAPKPICLLGQRYDFFERRGLLEAYGDLRRFYALLGAEDNVELFVGPTTHGYSTHNQEAMVSFFRRQAGLAGEAVRVESPCALPASELNVTAEGSVVKAGSRPLWELLAERASELREGWRLPSGTAGWQSLVRDLLQVPTLRETPHFRIPRAVRVAGRVWARYAVETEEPGVRAILKKRLEHPERCQTLDVEEEVHVLLPNWGSEDEAADEWVAGLNGGGALYALDVRGVGESRQEEERGESALQGYGTEFMLHSFGVMFGESYLGRRVYDVLRTLDLLVAEGARRVHLHGRGNGALLALFAGLLHESVVSVEEHEGLESYRSWLTDAVPGWSSACAVRGILRYADLPELREALSAALAERCRR